jgi:replication-associated recombination protein RarA
MPYTLSYHSFFPEELGERKYYRPGDSGREKDIAARLQEKKNRIAEMRKGKDEKKK